jgi:hypothetical protein
MPGPRVYSVDEANELIPSFEQAFTRIDEIRARLRATKIKLTAIEMIWGSEVGSSDCPDRDESVSLVEQLRLLEESFQEVVAELAGQSVSLKDVDEGLLDVYHVRDGHLVNLCWKRGEEAITTWHHVDAGYAGRQPL